MNGCLYWVISRVFKKIKEKQLKQQNIAQKPNENDKKVQSLTLPYKMLKGEHVVNTNKESRNH